MSSLDIHSWLSTASGDEDSHGTSESAWHKDRVLQEWAQAMEFAQNRLMTGTTTIRIRFLQEELMSVAKHEGWLPFPAFSPHDLQRSDLNLSQTLDIFKLLTLTYPKYADGASREAVEAVGMELVRRDEVRGTAEGPPDETKMGVAEQILGWLAHEVARISKHGSARCEVSMRLALRR